MAEETNRESNYLMIDFNIPEIKKYWDKIDKKDLYSDDTDDYGLQLETHVTLLDKIKNDVKWEDFRDYLLPLEDYISLFPSISYFEDDKFDVMKFDIKCENANLVHDRLVEYIKSDTEYPDYDAHATIAYAKKGCGKKYCEPMLDKIIEKKPFRFHYSIIKNGKQTDEYYTTEDLKEI